MGGGNAGFRPACGGKVATTDATGSTWFHVGPTGSRDPQGTPVEEAGADA